MGTFASRARFSLENGNLRILDPGSNKFVERVGQVTFSGEYARSCGQTVYYITERCVFRLTEAGLELIEIAPGVVLDRDILAHMAFRPIIPDNIRSMGARIFLDEPMGLRDRSPMS